MKGIELRVLTESGFSCRATWTQFLSLWKPPQSCFLKTVFSYKIGGKKCKIRKYVHFLEKRDVLAHSLMCIPFGLLSLAIKSEQLERAEI